jgi:hypothetical protein
MAEEQTNQTTTEQTQTQAEPTQTSASLLDQAPANADVTVDKVDTSSLEQAPATDRPEWLPEKFKTGEDLAKGYAELEGKLGGAEKVPENYDFSKTAEWGLNEFTDEQKTEAETVFKSYGLSQKQAEGMLALYGDSIKTAVGQIEQDYQSKYPSPDLDMENKSLQREWGNDYGNNLEQVKAFTKNLPKELMQYPIGETAEGVKMLYSMMQAAQGPNPMSNYSGSGNSPADIREKIRELRNDEKYALPQGDAVGEAHRAEIYRLYQVLERQSNQ